MCGSAWWYYCITQWLWSIMNEHATAAINMKGCTLMIDCRGTLAKWEKGRKERKRKEKKRKKTKEKSVHGRIRTCDLLLVKPTLLGTVLLLMC